MTTKQKTGTDLIKAERTRQITKEGFDFIHDESHRDSELIYAAMAYAYATMDDEFAAKDCWPWDNDDLKIDDDPIRNLVKAGALIAAEIDRMIAEKGERE